MVYLMTPMYDIFSGDNFGRLEAYNGGRWGTVCDDLWTMMSTQVHFTFSTSKLSLISKQELDSAIIIHGV